MNRPAPRRLLLVTGSLECGGSERQLADMANYWAATGHDVTLATWSGPHVADFYALADGVRRAYLDAGRVGGGRLRGKLRRVLKLRRLIAELAPDAVLSLLTRSNVPALLAGVGLPLRIVVSERVQPAHETGLQLGWRVLRRAVYGRAAAIVCQTQETAAWIAGHWGIQATVIPNALRPLPAAGAAREPLVLAVGRLVPQKGFDLLLDAFARVAPNFPDWRLLIAGEGPDRPALERRRRELGLDGRVDLPGRLAGIESWMARAGLVVQPSRFEGFPNAVLESMGMGAAVISADCPAGPAEIIRDGIDGRLVPVGDVPALTRAMEELMRDPALREQLGRGAVDVRERFAQPAVMDRWMSVLAPA